MMLMYWLNCHSTVKARPALTSLDQCGIVSYPAGLDFLCIGSDGESVHRLFLTGFLSSHNAQYVLLLFSTVRRCFSNVFQVVVRFVVSVGSDVDSQKPRESPSCR